MIRAIVWKEWREQRAIAAAVLAFGVGALALTAQFADPTSGGSVWSQAGARELMAQALAYLAGTVCGAMLLADEKEIGTLEFLDTLPARRRALWSGKVVFGLGLTVVQGAALAGLAVAFGCVDQRVSPQTYAAVVVLVGLLAFAWGMFGGALARSTLGAVFQGSVGSVVAGLGLAVVFVLLFGPRAFGRTLGPAALGFYLAWVGLGLFASALVFTAVDRERRARPGSLGPAAPFARLAPRPPRPPRLAGLRALLWLSARQARLVGLAVFGAAAAGGAIMLAPEAQPVFLWPALTLAFGVLAGITTLGEEQTRGVARFWAERRLPLNRFWLTKVAFHLALAVTAGLVLVLPLLVANSANPFRTRLLAPENLRAELGRFLLLGLVYGFAVGHLAGMVFRKAAVAGLVASVAATALVGFIYPSVIGGGAAAWQVWGPAVVLVLTARWLLHPWATERVAARGPVLRATGGAAAAAALLGAGIAYRVYEIPNVPDRLAESGFLASLPSFDENEGGRLAKQAVNQYRQAADAALDGALRPAPRDVRPAADGGRTRASDPLRQALQTDSWGPGSDALGRWLDRVFRESAADWLSSLDKLADAPVGVFEDPRPLDAFSPTDPYDDLYEMALALRARGLQRLSAGDAGAYPRLLRGGLAAVRTARNKVGREPAQKVLAAEVALLHGLDRWLELQRGRPDLLRPLLADLVRHEREAPVGWEDTRWAEQVILRNTMDRVGTWLAPRRLSTSRSLPPTSDPRADSEAEVVAFAWSVPWERARRERILRVHTQPAGPPPDEWLSDLHLKRLWRAVRAEPEPDRDLRALGYRRFAILQAALRLYELGHGRAADDLSALVPTYLSAVPVDPYTGAPFRYRVSAGETLPYTVPALPGGPVRPDAMKADPGDGVLWSAGPDRSDDGGRRPLSFLTPVGRAEDWIVIVRKAAPAGGQ